MNPPNTEAQLVCTWLRPILSEFFIKFFDQLIPKSCLKNSTKKKYDKMQK